MPETAKDLLEKVEALRATVMDEGRPDAVSKRRAMKRMTLRERISSILDESSFRARWNADLATPADGVVCGKGAVDARPIMGHGTAFTVHGGSTGRHGMLKHARLAEQTLPH